MNLRSISLIPTDLHEDILEVRANNKKHFASKKNRDRAVTTVRRAVETEQLTYGKVHQRGDNIYLVLSETAEENVPKRSRGKGRKKNTKLLSQKIVRAKVGV